jgi:hypothetical protein
VGGYTFDMEVYLEMNIVPHQIWLHPMLQRNSWEDWRGFAISYIWTVSFLFLVYTMIVNRELQLLWYSQVRLYGMSGDFRSKKLKLVQSNVWLQTSSDMTEVVWGDDHDV